MEVLQTKRPESGFHIALNLPKFGRITMASQLGNMDSSLNVLVGFCSLAKLVIDPSLMSISSFIQEL